MELGALDYSVDLKSNGRQAIGMGITQAAGSNAREVINQVKDILKTASSSFPSGISYVYMVDANEYLNASIEKVLSTLVEAFFILVFIVVFVFLQDFRSTAIRN